MSSSRSSCRSRFLATSMVALAMFATPAIVTANSSGLGIPCDVDNPQLGRVDRKFANLTKLDPTTNKMVDVIDTNTGKVAAWPMWWTTPQQWANDLRYTLRAGDGPTAQDATSYTPGQYTEITIRANVQDKQFTGLLMYAVNAAGQKVGEWLLPPRQAFQIDPASGCVTHSNADPKNYKSVFRVKFPPGTGTVTIKALVKYGLAFPVLFGEFWYPNSQQQGHLKLTEGSQQNQVWFQGAVGQSCDQVCRAVGGQCDLTTMKSSGASSTALLSAVSKTSSCFGPMMKGCGAYSPTAGSEGCFYQDSTCTRESVTTDWDPCKLNGILPYVPGKVYRPDTPGPNEPPCCTYQGFKWCANYYINSAPEDKQYGPWRKVIACPNGNPTIVPPQTPRPAVAMDCTSSKNSDKDGRRLCACSGVTGTPGTSTTASPPVVTQAPPAATTKPPVVVTTTKPPTVVVTTPPTAKPTNAAATTAPTSGTSTTAPTTATTKLPTTVASATTKPTSSNAATTKPPSNPSGATTTPTSGASTRQPPADDPTDVSPSTIVPPSDVQPSNPTSTTPIDPLPGTPTSSGGTTVSPIPGGQIPLGDGTGNTGSRMAPHMILTFVSVLLGAIMSPISSSSRTMFTIVAAITLLGHLPGSDAHNWLTSPSRANGGTGNGDFNGNTAPPCPPKGTRVHAQVAAGQRFQMEWASGHGYGSFTYLAVLKASDESSLMKVTFEVMDDYIKNAPASAAGYMADTKAYHVRPNDPAPSGDKGYASYLNFADTAFTTNFKRPDNFRQYPRGAFAYKKLDTKTALDKRVAYSSLKYPYLVAVHKFALHEDHPEEMDGAFMEIPAGSPPGQYVVQYQWRGYYDCMDINVLDTQSTDIYGKAVAGPAGMDKYLHTMYTPSLPTYAATACKELQDGDTIQVCQDECMGKTVDQCTGVTVAPATLNTAIVKFKGLFSDGTSHLPPVCAGVAKNPANLVCYSVKAGTTPQVGPAYKAVNDPEDPVFYMTTYIRKAGWTFAQPCTQCVPPLPPADWRFTDKCISCSDVAKNFYTQAPPKWNFIDNCQHCDNTFG